MIPSCSGGILLLDKPEGVTSFQLLNPVKRMLNTKKVGHTGTLDKFASGLIIALVGRYTKLNPYITALDKKYTAGIIFGSDTDTLDPEGKVVRQIPLPEESSVRDLSSLFLGKQKQIPPRFSAVHINGKRAHKMARAGEAFEVPERDIEIFDLILNDLKLPHSVWHIHCSKGTYIRSLARDMGLSIRSCASLFSLRRTAVGQVDVSRAVSFNPDGANNTLSPMGIRDIPELFPGITIVEIRGDALHQLQQGIKPKKDMFQTKPLKGLNLALCDNREVALLSCYGDELKLEILLELNQ